MSSPLSKSQGPSNPGLRTGDEKRPVNFNLKFKLSPFLWNSGWCDQNHDPRPRLGTAPVDTGDETPRPNPSFSPDFVSGKEGSPPFPPSRPSVGKQRRPCLAPVIVTRVREPTSRRPTSHHVSSPSTLTQTHTKVRLHGKSLRRPGRRRLGRVGDQPGPTPPWTRTPKGQRGPRNPRSLRPAVSSGAQARGRGRPGRDVTPGTRGSTSGWASKADPAGVDWAAARSAPATSRPRGPRERRVTRRRRGAGPPRVCRRPRPASGSDAPGPVDPAVADAARGGGRRRGLLGRGSARPPARGGPASSPQGARRSARRSGRGGHPRRRWPWPWLWPSPPGRTRRVPAPPGPGSGPAPPPPRPTTLASPAVAGHPWPGGRGPARSS